MKLLDYIVLVLLFGLLIGLTSCSKDDILDDGNLPPSTGWVTKSEKYSRINETTGFYVDQKYFTNYPHADILKSTRLQDQSAHVKLYWGSGMSSYVVDYDGDDQPDLVSLGFSMCDDHVYSYHNGKIIFNSNMSYPRLAYDSFKSGIMEFNDFDGDGISDMIAIPSVMKMNMYIAAENIGGQYNFAPVLPRLYSHKTGNTYIEVGLLGDSHTVTSGDVDNDGDIDFIQLPMPASYNNEPFDFEPSVNLNLGNGSFTNINLFSDYLHLAQGSASPSNYYATASELFDVNGDGYLDLVLGGPIGATKGCELYPRLSTCLNGPILLLGDGSGQFKMNSRIELNETFHTSRNWTGEVLGFGFTDYDNDGDIDIISTSTRTEPDGTHENGLYYAQYELNLFRNDNNTFTDVTELDMVGSFNSFREFPAFYSVRMIDVDDDGDYDIVPDRVENFYDFTYSKTLHWKNTGGKFERSY